MNRYASLFVACTALLVTSVAFADDPADPIARQLEVARNKYKKEIEQFDVSVKRLLEKKEEAARKAGNKAALETLKAELDRFDKDRVVPAWAPMTFAKKLSIIRGELEEAHRTAIKEYTRKRADDSAKKIEVELKEFQNESILAATKMMLIGTWKLRLANGYTTNLIYRENGTVEYTASGATLDWKIDVEAGLIIAGGDKIKLPLNEEQSSGTNIDNQSFVVSKVK